uniref:Uncharacterized protein n=1 Tax=Octopus bimaculoides TaxID=37653 RepID=A0A0L8GM67_OCTBM
MISTHMYINCYILQKCNSQENRKHLCPNFGMLRDSLTFHQFSSCFCLRNFKQTN